MFCLMILLHPILKPMRCSKKIENTCRYQGYKRNFLYCLRKLNHYGLKVHRFGAGDLKSPRGLFFNNKIRVRTIFWSSMVLQVLIDHLVCDISGAPAAESYCPKVITPVSLF